MVIRLSVAPLVNNGRIKYKMIGIMQVVPIADIHPTWVSVPILTIFPHK
jgi:hypothetical protein